MDAESARQRVLRETLNVARIGRTFEAVNQNNLPAWIAKRLMLENGNTICTIDLIISPSSGKPILINAPGPKISGDR